MELKTHTKSELIKNGHKDFVEHVEGLIHFFSTYYINELTMQHPKPKSLIGPVKSRI